MKKQLGVFSVMIGLFWLIPVIEVSAQTPHEHFDTERVKPGVVMSRAYRTQAEIDDAWFSSNGEFPPGHVNAAAYDPVLDGAAMPVRYNVAIGQLRKNNTFAGVTQALWIEFEVYLPSILYDFNFVVWDSMKLFRIFREKDGCNDDTFMTSTWSQSDNNTLWFRGHCGLPNASKTGFSIPADRWMRLHYHIDLNAKLYEAWAIDVAQNTAQKFFTLSGQGMSPASINQAAPILHSTSRGHSGSQGPAYPDFQITYRNLLVSTNPIALPSGTSDTTPPAPVTGLTVAP